MTLPPEPTGIGVVGQDPRYGGGFRTMASQFWVAATTLERNPRLHYLSRSRMASFVARSVQLRWHPESQGEFEGTAVPSLLPELDGVNQVIGGMRIARRLDPERSLWVVAATAPYGYGALRSRRPYACWLATGLESEWAGRKQGLDRWRRLALTVNAPVLRHLERKVVRNAAAVYSISPAATRSLAAASGLEREQIPVLSIPVDLTRFRPEPDETWGARLAEPTLIFVGRADDPRKNVQLLLRAFPLIREAVPNARLQIVGEHPTREDALLAGPGVEILGLVNDVVDVLPKATLLVLPSLQEGFGIVVAEALACGVPVVVTPSGGPEDLVRDSRAGILLASFRREELVRRVVDLLRDPARLRRMRADGRAYVELEHSPERFRSKLGEAIERLESGCGSA